MNGETDITMGDGRRISLAECKDARIRGCLKHSINIGRECPDCEAEFVKWLMGVLFFGAPKGPQVEIRLGDKSD